MKKWTAPVMALMAVISCGTGTAQTNLPEQASPTWGPPPSVDRNPNSPINPRVEAATSHLNIDDATRARYRWHLGEWWFKNEQGNWLYHRDGHWLTYNPNTYQPPASLQNRHQPKNRQVVPHVSRSTPATRKPATPAPRSEPSPPTTTQSANGYTYVAPSYQPIPPRNFFYGTGYPFGGGSYGTRRGGFYRGYSGGFGRRYGGFPNRRYNRGYGHGPYRSGYVVPRR